MADNLFKETIKQLLDVAERDGVITGEELELMDQIRIDAQSYALNLEEAKSDGIVTEDEAVKLSKLREMIIERAEIVANIDGRLSPDEKELLQVLKEFINKRFVH